jgi:AAA domain
MSNYSQVPQPLKEFRNWVVWKYEDRGKKNPDGTQKFDKVPYDAVTGTHAKSNDAATWCDFKTAVDSADVLSGKDCDGIGFEFGDSPYTGIDFDGVIADGKPEPYVIAILDLLGRPYSEFSPSTTGLHTIVEGKLASGLSHRFSQDHCGAEVYSTGRYFTVTGDRYAGEGIPKVEDFSIPHFLLSQILDKEFKHLWLGGLPNRGNDRTASGTDFQLLLMLRRKLNTNDPKVLENYFNASVPGHRKKWQRKDYRNRTIAKVLEGESSATAQELEFHLPAAEVTTYEDDDFVVDPLPSENPNEKYDGWFPLGSPSLVGGLSGSSKTTWMVQLLHTQLYKQEFFGHTTRGRPYLIIMADRGAASHRRTMRRMGFEPDIIPIKHISVKTGLAALQEIVNTIEATSPIPQVVFIEGLDMLVDDANKKSVVSPFMAALQKIAEHYHIAIIGSVGAPKTKAGEGYVAKRDNISGTEAWSRLSETVVLLQYPNGKDTAIERELSVLPRNAASESFALVFDRGRLRLQTKEDHKRLQINEDVKLRWVQEQANLAIHDPKKQWWTVLDMMRGLKQPNGKDMPKTTAHRWVQDACTKRIVVEKPGRRGHNTAAEFRWNESKLNPQWSGTSEDIEHGGEKEEMVV